MDYDAIVIGSGVGGLAAASLLAQRRGARVLVLERHFKAGGFNHAFTRRGYHWDVGLHYVGQMGRGSGLRDLMDAATAGAVDWTPMPDVFDVYHHPDVTIERPAGRAAYRAALVAAFPGEAAAIDRYFADVAAASAWVGPELFSWGLPPGVRHAVALAGRPRRGLALRTTADHLARLTPNPRLRAVLTSLWGDYALPPERSAFALHAMIDHHYLDGAWYPVGGSDALTDAMIAAVRGAGGDCLVNHDVTEILLERGRAVGVRAATKRGGAIEVRAPLVLSDAGVRNTLRLLPDAALPGLRRRLGPPESGVGAVTVYLGLSRSAASLGFAGENHWFCGDDPAGEPARLLAGRPTSGYLSFPSLKDPTATKPTAEIVSHAAASDFAAWAGTRWMRRGADYTALKDTIAAGLIGLVDRHRPGFADLVDHVEVSTPVTVHEFAGHPSGGFAELAGTPDRFRRRLVPARSGLPGLRFTGADVMTLGIAGALVGALFAVGPALGWREFGRLMSRLT